MAALMAAASGDVRSEAEQVLEVLEEEGSPPGALLSAPAFCQTCAVSMPSFWSSTLAVVRFTVSITLHSEKSACSVMYKTHNDMCAFLLQPKQQRRRSSW